MRTQLPRDNYPAARQVLADLFAFPKMKKEAMLAAFTREIEAGLAGRPGRLKMIPTYMTLPSGNEEGDFLAIDMGGTNLRVMVVRLSRELSEPRVLHVRKCRLSASDMKQDAHILFSRIAGEINRFLLELRQQGIVPLESIREVGFTFSYPATMVSRNQGKIVALAKELTATGLLGENPFDLLFKELRDPENSPEGFTPPELHPAALLNDTVTELIYAAYLQFKSRSASPCRIGGIIGTGHNFAMVLDTSRIPKFRDPACGLKQMILNLESGNFGDPTLPRTVYDEVIDRKSPNPGEQWMEKTIAGNYLGRIAGAVLQDLVEAGYLLTGDAPTRKILEDFSCVRMSNIEKDFAKAPETALAELRAGGLAAATPRDLAVVKDVAALVSGRAAEIAATSITAIIRFIDGEEIQQQTVAIDGSVFGKYPGYKARMEQTLAELNGADAARIRLAYISDGSGIGAAIAAGAK